MSWGAGIVRRYARRERQPLRRHQLLARGGAAVTILSASMSSKDSSHLPGGGVVRLTPSATIRSGEVTCSCAPDCSRRRATSSCTRTTGKYLLFPTRGSGEERGVRRGALPELEQWSREALIKSRMRDLVQSFPSRHLLHVLDVPRQLSSTQT